MGADAVFWDLIFAILTRFFSVDDVGEKLLCSAHGTFKRVVSMRVLHWFSSWWKAAWRMGDKTQSMGGVLALSQLVLRSLSKTVLINSQE